MKYGQIGLIVLGIAILAVVVLLLLIVLRRERCRRKIRRMEMCQKVRRLNELAEPFGFLYVPEQDIFTTCRDAWQRRMGYEVAFDRVAGVANMVIDAQPVYFDYDGRTWLIEFWKGQYGINTGSEVGIYHAEGIVFPESYGTAHFDAAEDYEMPYIRSRLVKGEKMLYELAAVHWWLTGFVMGMFSKPGKLRLETCITFDTRAMAEAFMGGLDNSAVDRSSYRICGNSVCVEMTHGEKISWAEKLCRIWASFWNRFWVAAFRVVKAPFSNTADRMLFLYCQLPWCFRRILGRDRRCRRRSWGKYDELPWQD